MSSGDIYALFNALFADDRKDYGFASVKIIHLVACRIFFSIVKRNKTFFLSFPDGKFGNFSLCFAFCQEVFITFAEIKSFFRVLFVNNCGSVLLLHKKFFFKKFCL